MRVAAAEVRSLRERWTGLKQHLLFAAALTVSIRSWLGLAFSRTRVAEHGRATNREHVPRSWARARIQLQPQGRSTPLLLVVAPATPVEQHGPVTTSRSGPLRPPPPFPPPQAVLVLLGVFERAQAVPVALDLAHHIRLRQQGGRKKSEG